MKFAHTGCHVSHMIFPGIALVFCGTYLQLAPVKQGKNKKRRMLFN
jgi:hypothetical protein